MQVKIPGALLGVAVALGVVYLGMAFVIGDIKWLSHVFEWDRAERMALLWFGSLCAFIGGRLGANKL